MRALRNESVLGLRVRARIASCCHVADPSDPEGFRHIAIPEGAIGTLTGEILVATEILSGDSVDIVAILEFAADSKRIRQALQKIIVSIKADVDYWEAVRQLSGDDKLAARTALVVRWDGIAEREPGTSNCASYIPWLELLDVKETPEGEG